MLYEIVCDKFISNAQQRGKIYFHDGLNVIQGHNSGTNSIGKSTFLLVVDFAFGGNTYAKNKKIIKKSDTTPSISVSVSMMNFIIFPAIRKHLIL